MEVWKKVVSERFEKEVVLHLLRIYSDKVPDAPLILGIDGPMGEGKTFQCSLILERLKVKPYRLSAGDFESKEAGEPAQLIRDTYKKACDYVLSKKGNMAAIIIDDADVAFGKWGDLYQYTVNTQTIIGELMNLADRKMQTEYSIKIPIYLTGNDFSKLYAPLKRDGRMNTFYWKPSAEEKFKAVYFMFDFLDVDDCKNLICAVNEICRENELKEAPISFYAALEANLYDEDIWLAYKNNKENCFYINNDYIKGVEFKNSAIGLEALIDRAKEKIRQTVFANTNHI